MKEIDITEIYGLRTLIFIETEPQSNKYFQIYLSDVQFKEMTTRLGEKVGEENHIDIMKINAGMDVYDLPDLKQINL